jgi:peroxiredoxin Q/BCP
MTPKKKAAGAKSTKKAAKKRAKKAVVKKLTRAKAKPAKTAKPKKTKPRAAISTKAMSVEKGGRAPDFTLASDQGGEVTLSALRGKKVVLYFYPKDDTPGCTVQACDFRDAQPTFAGLDAVVLGVSADSVASHEKFRDKFGLNFPLLADQDHAVSSAYGVWKEKSMYGRTFMGIERSTFLIDEDGVVVEAWRKVTPQGHAEMLAGVLEGL